MPFYYRKPCEKKSISVDNFLEIFYTTDIINILKISLTVKKTVSHFTLKYKDGIWRKNKCLGLTNNCYFFNALFFLQQNKMLD